MGPAGPVIGFVEVAVVAIRQVPRLVEERYGAVAIR
jgi:hypothetical protein